MSLVVRIFEGSRTIAAKICQKFLIESWSRGKRKERFPRIIIRNEIIVASHSGSHSGNCCWKRRSFLFVLHARKTRTHTLVFFIQRIFHAFSLRSVDSRVVWTFFTMKSYRHEGGKEEDFLNDAICIIFIVPECISNFSNRGARSRWFHDR